MSSRATSRSQSAKSSAGGRGLYELNQLYRGLECDWVLPFPLPSICSGPRALITDGTKPNHIAHAPLGVSRAAAAPAHSSAAALYPMCLLSNCFAHPPPANQVESEESNTWSGWASSNRAVTPSNFTHQGKGASVVEIMQRRCRFLELLFHTVTMRSDLCSHVAALDWSVRNILCWRSILCRQRIAFSAGRVCSSRPAENAPVDSVVKFRKLLTYCP